MSLEIIKRQARTKERVGGATLDQWLRAAEQAADGDEGRRVAALGGPVRSLHDRSRFSALKRHYYRESDTWKGHCGRGELTTCGQRAGNAIHFQSYEGEINRVSRAALEREDLDSGPRNAVTDDNGFRVYQWHPEPSAIAWLTDHGLPTGDVNVMSVTSIRKACGEGFQLVNWQITNMLDVATGMEKTVEIGPRGGIAEKRVSTEWPPAILARILATEGSDEKLMKVRAAMRDTANQPRDRAGARGTIVHEAVELGTETEDVDLDYVTAARNRLDAKDRNKMKTVTPQDVKFISYCLANYWDMRAKRPFVILAKEPQVWNLTVGYSGSADALFWFLPEGTSAEIVWYWQGRANKGLVTLADILEFGGVVVLGDWKTSKDVHTDHVLQVTAYMSAEFIATDGVIDERLSEIIRHVRQAALVNIRPNGWGVYGLKFRDDALMAFLGSVQMARFLMTYKEPDKLFEYHWSGRAGESEVDS